MKTAEFFAPAAKHLSELLAAELKDFGAEIIAIKLAGVAFRGDLSVAYRACLGSRLANRILLPIACFEAPDPETLYAEMYKINWSQHFGVQDTFAIDFSSSNSSISHTQYGAQKAKDAIVDQFRARFNERPSVKLDEPSVRINIYLQNDKAVVSIDLAGESLHKRGYREDGGQAPLKETLACAILMRAGWPEIAARGGALIDIMCGSGTLPIEAALMAHHIAPGLLRDYFGFLGWKKHNEMLWQKIKTEAETKIIPKISAPIIGYDADGKIIKQAIANLNNTRLNIHFEKRELANIMQTEEFKKHPGLIIANPPYGERMGDAESLKYLYQNIAEKLKANFPGWQAAIFTGNPELGKSMGLRAYKHYALYNGPIACRLLLFKILPEYFVVHKHREAPEIKKPETVIAEDDPVYMFIQRVKKNLKHLEKWAKRENISCYRIYDADLPEYAVAIDLYENHCHVQEYAPPKSVDRKKAQERLESVQQVLPQALNIPAENIFYKLRHKQTREKQYEKLATEKKLIPVSEFQATLLINLKDYLDTGLFLDQRYVRQKIYQLAKNKRFLNLFAYTASASVFAALGGAKQTVSVDMSATYLNWARKNFAVNGLNETSNAFIQADCIAWLAEQWQEKKLYKKLYDVIFIAPPVFSRSKRMDDVFDIERDHVNLLRAASGLLAPEGIMIFATHCKNFKLDTQLLKLFTIDDWHKTLPEDFARSANSYFCWALRKVRTA